MREISKYTVFNIREYLGEEQSVEFTKKQQSVTFKGKHIK